MSRWSPRPGWCSADPRYPTAIRIPTPASRFSDWLARSSRAAAPCGISPWLISIRCPRALPSRSAGFALSSSTNPGRRLRRCSPSKACPRWMRALPSTWSRSPDKAMSKPTVTFGEIMLRLAPPGYERFLQSPQFVATFGGGEANVAVALAGFGLPAAYVTVLPPANPIADAVIAQLRGFGVDTANVLRAKGRMGVYYVEAGANQRPSKVVYDRDGSSIALAKPGDIDWNSVFAGAGWVHITCITPALSASAAALALEPVSKARETGLTASSTLNYRTTPCTSAK